MKIVKATFEQIYYTGQQYLNQRLGGEILLEDGDTLEDAWEKLKEDANAMHKKQFPHLYDINTPAVERNYNPLTPEPIPEVKIQRPSNATEGIIFDINSVTDIKVLESYKLMAKTNSVINEAYQNKLKELS